MKELERVIWKVAITAAGMVAVLAGVNGMTAWTEAKSAAVRSAQAEQAAAKEQEEARQKDLNAYMQSLHDRETERRKEQ
jgi:type II secretory pathway component PulL